MKNAIFIGAILIALGIGVYATFAVPSKEFSEADTIGNGPIEFKDLKKKFQDLAEKKGADYAFQVLARAKLPLDTDLHLLGHAVGDILYKQMGTSGISHCSMDFRNACSHSVVVGALLDYGEGALPEIRKACHEAPGGLGAYTMCYHGLGHGVYSFFNFDIPKTVAMCKKTGTPQYGDQEAKQCIGGAIMELMGGGDHDKESWEQAREKYLTEPLAPCNEAMIPAELKFFCYSYLTPRLMEQAGIMPDMHDLAGLPTAFSYCEKVPERENRQICNEGFGKELVPLAGGRDIRAVDKFGDEQLTKIAGWCQAGRTLEARADCVNGALHSLYWGGENDPHAAARLCAVSPVAVQDSCYKAFAKDTSYYVPEPEKNKVVCGLVPEKYSSLCVRS